MNSYNRPTITQQEWRWLIIVSICILALSTIPYIAGYLAETPNQRFGGAFINWLDYNTYLAKMWQGYRGSWGYEIAFTTEPHTPAFLIYIFYILLGHAARLTGLSLPLTYQVARVVFGFLMLLACYDFITYFLERIRARRIAFLLSSAALGLGWLTQILAPIPAGEFGPMDFWFTEGYLYLSLLTSPHFSASVALSLTIFILLLLRPVRPWSGKTLLAGLLSVALGLVHPYMLLLVDLLLAVYWGFEVVRKRRIPGPRTLSLAVAALIQAPLIGYYYWLFYTQPVFSDWLGQTVCASPPPHVYLLGYHVLLPLAIAGAVARFWKRKEAPVFPLIWVGVVALLIYFPSSIQRRFVEGVQVPLAILAAVGLTEVVFPAHRRPSRRRRYLFLQAMVVTFTLIGTLFITAGLSMAAANHVGVLSWPADLVSAAEWLEENVEYRETVLAGPDTSNFLAGRAGHRVVAGHPMETLQYASKVAAVNRFFDSRTTESEHVELLSRWEVSYVLHGPEEQSLGGFDPAAADWAQLVFECENVRVYQATLERYE